MNEPQRSNGDNASGGSGDSGHAASAGPGAEMVHTSRLAMVACVLAIVSLVLLPGLIPALSKGASPWLRHVYPRLTLGTALCAAVLGVVSLIRIGLHGGRLTGRGPAWVGVAAPVVACFLSLVLILTAIPRSGAFRMTCGTNLSGLGKAMLIYANDYDDELPRSGGHNSVWGPMSADAWCTPDRRLAFGLGTDGSAASPATITSCFYLLVKYAEVTPRTFICRGSDERGREKGMSEFQRRTYRVPDKNAELVDFWDFGPTPWLHCSYAYHMPFGPYALTTSSEPGFAVAADRNPWIDSPSARARDFSQFRPDVAPFGGTAEQARNGNTPPHRLDGQNVLFLDSHVEFARRAYCSVEDDNIYTVSRNDPPGSADLLGTPPNVGSQPTNRKDALLVNDPPVAESAVSQRK